MRFLLYQIYQLNISEIAYFYDFRQSRYAFFNFSFSFYQNYFELILIEENVQLTKLILKNQKFNSKIFLAFIMNLIFYYQSILKQNLSFISLRKIKIALVIKTYFFNTQIIFLIKRLINYNIVVIIYKRQNYLEYRMEVREAFLEKENKNQQNISFNENNNNDFKQFQATCIDKCIKRNTLVSKFLKKDNFQQKLKQAYTKFVVEHYYNEITLTFRKENKQSQCFLKNHDIIPHLRSKMIDWMIQVLSSYKMSEEVFFRSVWIMDQYFKLSTKVQTLKQLHLIGVVSMFIACKYQQVYPIKMQTFCNKICRAKFTPKQMSQKECQILLTLNFKLQTPTLYSWFSHIQISMQQNLQVEIKNYLREVILYLAKMSLFDYGLSQQNFNQLAVAVIFIAMKTVEQVQSNIKPEEQLGPLCQIFCLNCDQVLKISKKVLELAKNFSKFYPQLTNLKKFNKFNFKREIQ